MSAETRKPVIFNLENPRDKALFDVAEKIGNFSGWVKDALEIAARNRGVSVPEAPKGKRNRAVR